MPSNREPEKGSFVKLNLPDWFNTKEAKEALNQAYNTGLPTSHIRGKEPNEKSQILIPFDDGDSPYKRLFSEYIWITICAKASKMHMNHGLLWLTNYKDLK